MVRTEFTLKGETWLIKAFLNINGTYDIAECYEELIDNGCPDYKARNACMVLSQESKGYTFTNFDDRITLMFASRTTDAAEMYDTISHEVRHITDHIGDYYNVVPKSEESAYLQGEISRQLFPAAAQVLCPNCRK